MGLKSLGLKIALAFLVVALLPFAGLSLLASLQVQHGTRHLVEESLSLLVSELGVGIERTVFSATAHVRSLAENPVIQASDAPLAAKLAEMRKVQDLYQVFEDITLVNLDGVVLASTTYEYRGEWKNKEWFRQAKAGESTVSPAHVVPAPFRLVLVVTAPVRGPDGAVQAVLGGQVNMKTIWEITDRLKVGGTGYVFVTDRAGNLIAYPDKRRLLDKLTPDRLREEVLNRDVGAAEFSVGSWLGFCQFVSLHGYQTYRGQGWRVGIIQDRNETYAVVDRMRRAILRMAAIGMVFILVLSWLFSRTVIHPIQELNAALQRVTEGDLDVRVTVRSRDEIGALGTAFNTMAEEIRRKTTALDAANQSLNAVNTKLTESNTNLQQFAYVASHDLQEPLRMVSSYVQLLARRYQGRLDAEADEFIRFAVDGAVRMQQLINDLLEYSRIGTREKPMESTDAGAALTRALDNLAMAMLERRASVTRDELPTVVADASQLAQLFQNLIGNAIKFCRGNPPQIHVSATREGDAWRFSVRDNGIGIDPAYADRIFAIFQRLHTRDEYPGTGVGLAICKRIVQRHGGRIWVESQPGGGSTFCFTLPVTGG